MLQVPGVNFWPRLGPGLFLAKVGGELLCRPAGDRNPMVPFVLICEVRVKCCCLGVFLGRANGNGAVINLAFGG